MKDFLKYVLANFVALAIVGGACAILFILFISATVASSKPVAQVPAKAVLVYNLSNVVVDKPVTEDFNTFLRDVQGNLLQTSTLRSVLDALRDAKEDERITALYLTGNVMGTSWANLAEIRTAILDFKESGKPVVAYGQYLREVDYYMASTADQILMHPDGASRSSASGRSSSGRAS